ncbi:MAG: RnfABCDGE type electron transport complex subunit G [Mariprofundus sp.]|nr:RnfABCDGE type electron transport complex subunit G [Mariprofundus sp.]
MKLDKDQIRMVIALFVVASIAAVLLATTDIITREPIAAAQKAALHQALQQVLPEHSNDPQNDKITLGQDDAAVVIYPAKDAAGHIAGMAWEVVAPDGYSGSVRILVGVRPDDSVFAIRVTQHQETPGLGDGIVKNDGWLADFVGQNLSSKQWKVKKDGGDFDQFTGATITPRAVVKAVKGALEFFKQQKTVIFARLTTAEADHKTGGAHE